MDTHLNKINTNLYLLDSEYSHLMADDLASEIHTLLTILERDNRSIYTNYYEMLTTVEELNHVTKQKLNSLTREITDEEVEVLGIMEEIRDEVFELIKQIELKIEYNHISYKGVE